MKTTRKIITLALALILALALAVPAFAATGGTITVTGTSGTVYTVYKMFDVDPAGVTSGNKYKITAAWADFADVAGVSTYFKVENDYVIWKKATTSAADAAAVAQLARAYVESKSLTSTQTVTAGSSALPLDDDGYYLLVPDNTSASGVKMIANGADITITEKTVAEGLPVVEKEVKEDSTGIYGTSNTADIGQIIEYQTTITAGDSASKYVLHDKMDTYIEFKNDVTVTHNGNSVASAGNYTVTTTTGDGCTFHVEFTDSLCDSLAEHNVLVVKYTGKLKEGAATETDHENRTWLTHTTESVKTNESIVATQTYKIEAIKMGKQGAEQAPLAGAGFVLRDNNNQYYKWDDVNEAVIWVDNIEQATVKTSGADGKFSFVGVDAEDFTLVEKVVPGGYTGVGETAVSTTSGDVEYGTVTVVNTLGTALPETGGIGTTVFYVLGGVLLIGALVVLATLKRKESSAQ
jgi:fimbrial isopeptide formation D2 family protein/LPXTG-motif cell wall-anchored protein